MKNAPRQLLVVTMLVTAFFASGARAAQCPAEVNRTHQAIAKLGNPILKFAYPTARKDSATVTKSSWDDSFGGYVLDETISYLDSDGNSNSMTLRFRLNGDGTVKSIGTLGQTEWWPPFGTGNVMLAVMKAAAQNEIDDARRRGVEPSKLARTIASSDDIQSVLAAIVNLGR